MNLKNSQVIIFYRIINNTRASFLMGMMLLFFVPLSYGQKKPDWVQSIPKNNQYYIGVGHAVKKNNADYKEDAKQGAIAEISNSISVNVSGESLLSQTEMDDQFKEEFSATLKTKSENEIYGLQKYEEWNGRKEYWVYYRVNKEEFKRIRKQKISDATKKGLALYEKALEFDKKNNISQALYYYGQSVASVRSFLNENLLVETKFGEEIYLGKEITNHIYSMQKELRFDYELPAIHTSRGLEGEQLKITVKRNNKAVPNVPVLVYSDPKKALGEEKELICDSRGKTSVLIPFSARAFNNTHVGIGIDYQKLLHDAIKDPEIVGLFEQMETLYTSFLLKKSAISGHTSDQFITKKAPKDDKKKDDFWDGFDDDDDDDFGDSDFGGGSSFFSDSDDCKSYEDLYKRLNKRNYGDMVQYHELEKLNIKFKLSHKEFRRVVKIFESPRYQMDAIKFLIHHCESTEGLYDLLKDLFKGRDRKDLKEFLSDFE